MRVLVIGGGGFIGRHLVEGLRAGSMEVAVMSSREGTGIDVASGYLRPDFAIPPGTEVVYYLAASPAHKDNLHRIEHLFAVNAASAIAVGSRAFAAGVRRVVYASTGNVYGPSFSPMAEDAPVRRDNAYALSKIHAEEALALFRPDMEVVIARLFGVYGPGQTNRLVPNLVESVHVARKVIVQRNPNDPSDIGGLKLSLCHVDDVVTILARLGTEGGPPCINVASGEVVNVRQIADAAGGLLGRRALIEFADQPRAFDLIADNSLLRRTHQHRFTPFAQGIEGTVRAGAHTDA